MVVNDQPGVAGAGVADRLEYRPENQNGAALVGLCEDCCQCQRRADEAATRD